MEDGDFEWHAPKRELNLEKHGIAFEDAVTIWSGPVATRLSPHDREARFIPVGDMAGRIVVAVWTTRGRRRRLIPARRANTHERAYYTAFLEARRQGRH